MPCGPLPVMIASLLALVACSTPYEPSVPVAGGAPFPGIADAIAAAALRPTDVVLVHGMCTHDEQWAHGAIDRLAAAIDRNVEPLVSVGDKAAQVGGIEIVTKEIGIGLGTVRFSAIVWSPLTATLKRQLEYDKTGMASDCSQPGECKPQRARLNGILKDGLLDDCLADAMIYQGRSRDTIRREMVQALTRVVQLSEERASSARTAPGPLVLVTESLGSKVTFDALQEMLRSHAASDPERAAGNALLQRLAVVFMAANQLPILGLADEVTTLEKSLVGTALIGAPDDALQGLLRARAAAPPGVAINKGATNKAVAPAMWLIAFNDPNDLLSYRLQPSRYAVSGIAVTDVLVSNSPTLLGLLERPDKAHTAYLENHSVTRLIACGWPASARCP